MRFIAGTLLIAATIAFLAYVNAATGNLESAFMFTFIAGADAGLAVAMILNEYT